MNIYFNDKANSFSTFEELVNSSRAKTENEFHSYLLKENYYPVSKGMADEFYRDLQGTMNCHCSGIASERLVAEVMKISTVKATAYLLACAEYGITERQNGMWVV